MKGRKPTPTHLKVIKGNPGRRPLNRREPVAATALPEPPDWIGAEARDCFLSLRETLQELGYASASHTHALTLLAIQLTMVKQCSRILDEQGLTYTRTNTQGALVSVPRPEVAIRDAAAKQAQSLLAEFGLTPASASRIVVPSKQRNNAFSDL